MADSTTGCWSPASVIEGFIRFLAGERPSNPIAVVPAPTDSLPPPFVSEPPLRIEPVPGSGSRVRLGKPDFSLFDGPVRPDAPFLVVGTFDTRAEAEAELQKTPRLRFPARLQKEYRDEVGLLPLAAGDRRDWRGDPDATRVGERFQELGALLAVFQGLPDTNNTRFVQVRLPDGRRAQHHPDPADQTKSLILIDPYQLDNGLLDMAAIVAHELAHAKAYQSRGFDINRAAEGQALSREDFVTLYLEDEFACVRTAVIAMEQALSAAPESIRSSARHRAAAYSTEPHGYFFLSEGASHSERAARNAVIETYEAKAEAAYSLNQSVTPTQATLVAAWLSSSEWNRIQATRSLWDEARGGPP